MSESELFRSNLKNYEFIINPDPLNNAFDKVVNSKKTVVFILTMSFYAMNKRRSHLVFKLNTHILPVFYPVYQEWKLVLRGNKVWDALRGRGRGLSLIPMLTWTKILKTLRNQPTLLIPLMKDGTKCITLVKQNFNWLTLFHFVKKTRLLECYEYKYVLCLNS